MMIRSVTLAAVLALAACSGGPGAENSRAAETADAQPPRLDLSTPDRAVRSYWALTDSAARAERLDTTSAEYRRRAPWRNAWAAILTGEAGEVEAARQREAPETFAREIVAVQTESPTRAVVLVRIRNTSPIPPGVTPTEREAASRRDGNPARYVLERDSAGWRISQAQYQYAEGGMVYPRWDPTPLVPTFGLP